MKITKKQIRMARTAAAAANLSETDYIEIKKRFGVDHTCDIEMEQFDDFIDCLSSDEFSRTPFRDTAAEILKKINPPEKKLSLLKVTADLLAELNLPLAYANKIAKTMYGVDLLAWCSKQQIYVINGKLITQKRRRNNGKGIKNDCK